MIAVKNLRKKYGDFLAVDDISFEIKEGHIYGFLGPNGAGKSTTLNIMTGTLAATDGQVLINGLDIFEDAKEAKKMIGYLPEMPPLYVDQTPREYLKFVAQAKKISKSMIEEEIDKVIAETHIEDVSDKLIKYLSKGYKQRVGIAQALLGNPEVIILDEPTVGLDPVQIIEIRDLILELGKNHTVILSSHILTEVQAICDQILIIYKGKLVAFDTPDRLQDTFSSKTSISLQIVGRESEVTDLLKNVSGIQLLETGRMDGVIHAEVEVLKQAGIQAEEAAEEACKAIFYACAGTDHPILQMTTSKASLEDIFIELTNSEKEDLAGVAASYDGEIDDPEIEKGYLDEEEDE